MSPQHLCLCVLHTAEVFKYYPWLYCMLCKGLACHPPTHTYPHEYRRAYSKVLPCQFARSIWVLYAEGEQQLTAHYAVHIHAVCLMTLITKSSNMLSNQDCNIRQICYAYASCTWACPEYAEQCQLCGSRQPGTSPAQSSRQALSGSCKPAWCQTAQNFACYASTQP